MTYLSLLAVFVGIPILVLARCPAGTAAAAVSGRLQAGALAVLLGLALAATIPWDAALLARGTWTYPHGLQLGRIAGVPVEECLFMLLQPVLVALWLRRLPAVPPGRRPRLGARIAGPVALLVLAAAGVALATRPATSYLGLVLAWAAPPLALQWALGGDVLARRWRLLLRAALPPALYLCAVDRLALRLDLWQLSGTRTTGAAVLGLPVEEAVFFALTTALLAGGLILGTDRRVLRRCVPRAAIVPVGEAGRPSGGVR